MSGRWNFPDATSLRYEIGRQRMTGIWRLAMRPVVRYLARLGDPNASDFRLQLGLRLIA